jgi:pantothenate kinase
VPSLAWWVRGQRRLSVCVSVVNSFDEMLKLSAQGDNTAVDMLVGDIYGGNDYSSVGLAATTIASSFGKVVMDDSFSPSDYKPEDIALSLLRMISYNIAQVRAAHRHRPPPPPPPSCG